MGVLLCDLGDGVILMLPGSQMAHTEPESEPRIRTRIHFKEQMCADFAEISADVHARLKSTPIKTYADAYRCARTHTHTHAWLHRKLETCA